MAWLDELSIGGDVVGTEKRTRKAITIVYFYVLFKGWTEDRWTSMSCKNNQDLKWAFINAIPFLYNNRTEYT